MTTHAKSIILKVSMGSAFRWILHTRVIVEGPSAIVGPKTQRATPELIWEIINFTIEVQNFRVRVLIRQGSDLLTKNTLVMISNTTSCDSQQFWKGLVLT